MKKRILALSTAAVLALSLTACGSSQKTEETTAAADVYKRQLRNLPRRTLILNL